MLDFWFAFSILFSSSPNSVFVYTVLYWQTLIDLPWLKSPNFFRCLLFIAVAILFARLSPFNAKPFVWYWKWKYNHWYHIFSEREIKKEKYSQRTHIYSVFNGEAHILSIWTFFLLRWKKVIFWAYFDCSIGPYTPIEKKKMTPNKQ